MIFLRPTPLKQGGERVPRPNHTFRSMAFSTACGPVDIVKVLPQPAPLV
jgi:hypothetical protein